MAIRHCVCERCGAITLPLLSYRLPNGDAIEVCYACHLALAAAAMAPWQPDDATMSHLRFMRYCAKTGHISEWLDRPVMVAVAR